MNRKKLPAGKFSGHFFSLVLAGFSSSAAPIVWTGPQTTFTKAASADPTQAANQDRLTPNVWITRGNTEGLYNAKTETGFVHSLSPADTEWANGTTANYSSLSYTDWNTWAKGSINVNPPATVGVNAVLHLKSEDIYIDIKFTSWAAGFGSGGAFSYVRSTPATGNTPPSVSITNPISGATFTAPATFTVQASASDSDGSISQVQFFNNGTSLEVDTTTPYEVTIMNLAAGAYTLAAVATDNLNASTTNTVSITVNEPTPPPVQITVNPIFQQGVFGFSFLTQIGFTYIVQFTTNLVPVNWLTLTNFIGDGSVAHVTDSEATNLWRYYRVGAR